MKKFVRTRGSRPPSPAPPPAPAPAPVYTNGHANGVGARRDELHSTLSRYWSGSEECGGGVRGAGAAGAGAPLWEDPEFPPARALPDKRRHSVQWLRPYELCANPTFFGEELVGEEEEEGSGDDAATALAGHYDDDDVGPDRWRVEDAAAGPLCCGALWRACAALALTPRLLARVAPPHSFRTRYIGLFRFRFWVWSGWREVAVDDRLPARGGRLLGARAACARDFTLPLLEKAYAKLYGSYGSLAGVDLSAALQDLSGGVVQSFPLRPRRCSLQVLRAAVPRSTLLVATAAHPPHKHKLAAQSGLIGGHPYCVTGLARVRGAGDEAGALRRLERGQRRAGRAARRRPRPAHRWTARVLDAISGVLFLVRAAGAGARGARRLAARAGAARAPAVAGRAGAPRLAPRVQRGRAAQRAHRLHQPAVPRAGGGGALVPRGGGGGAAVQPGVAAAAAGRGVRRVRAGGRRARARARAARAARARRHARVARARGGDVLHAAGGPLPGAAAHAPGTHGRGLPAARADGRARAGVGAQRRQRAAAGAVARPGRRPRRRPAPCAAQGQQNARRLEARSDGDGGRRDAALAAAARVARAAAGAALARAVPRARGAARLRPARTPARARAARAGRAAGVLGRRASSRRGRPVRHGPGRLPPARAAARGRRVGQQQGGGVPRAALRARPPPAARRRARGARPPASRAREIPEPVYQDEGKPAVVRGDDLDDDLLVAAARGRR